MMNSRKYTAPLTLAPCRLSKFMAQQGICSRREADQYIEKGWVKINGKVVKIGQKIAAGDEITCDFAILRQQAAKLTVILHKPVGYVSAEPENTYRAAYDLIDAAHFAGDAGTLPPLPLIGLAPAGRLDIDSTGLLVLTQDGVLARQLIGSDSKVEKEYLVRVQGNLSPEGLALLNYGLSLDGEALRPAKVTWQNQDQLRFILRQGKKRQIRRMCEAVGLQVTGLKRVRIGRVRLGNLPLGQWRILANHERF